MTMSVPPRFLSSILYSPRTSDRARALFVDLAELDLAVEDLAAGRKVRTVDERHQLDVVDVAILRERDQLRSTISREVVRRDVRRHADGDAGRAVDEQVRKSRGQHGRLFGRAVVVRAHVDGLEVELAQQLHRGRARGGTRCNASPAASSPSSEPKLPEPSTSVQAHRPVLRQANHRVVDRDVAVRVIFADARRRRPSRSCDASHRAADGCRAASRRGCGAAPASSRRARRATRAT